MTANTEIKVDLLEGEVSFDGRSVRLTRRLAKLADILVSQMPNTVAHETAAARMWGDKEIDVEGNLKVAVSHLRPLLRPLGLNIVINWGRGYRIEVAPVLSRTERHPHHATEAARARA